MIVIIIYRNVNSIRQEKVMKKIYLYILALFVVVNILRADVERGRKVYLANCAQCHSVHMTGGLGRDFNLVSYTRRREEILAYASDPSSMYKKFGYRSNAMPTLPLTGDELEDIADYIDSLQPFKKWMVKKR